MVRICQAILNDENTVLPVSNCLEGYYGIDDVYLSVPAVLNKFGISRMLELDYSPDELKELKHSASVLRGVIEDVGIGNRA